MLGIYETYLPPLGLTTRELIAQNTGTSTTIISPAR